jgi:hypothetical protein
MAEFALDVELREYLATLPPARQREVLEYARSLGDTPRRGVHGSTLLRFSGAIDLEDLQSIELAVREGCGRIEASGW